MFASPIQFISCICKKKFHQKYNCKNLKFPCVGPTLCGCDITVLYSRLQPVGRGGSRAGTLTGPVSLQRPVCHHVPKLQIPQQHSVLSVQRRCARYPVPLRWGPKSNAFIVPRGKWKDSSQTLLLFSAVCSIRKADQWCRSNTKAKQLWLGFLGCCIDDGKWLGFL